MPMQQSKAANGYNIRRIQHYLAVRPLSAERTTVRPRGNVPRQNLVLLVVGVDVDAGAGKLGT